MGKLTVDCILRALLSNTLNYEGGGGLYFFKQISAGLKYFGRSDCPEERIESHLRYYLKSKGRLHLEMAKYGLDDFECDVIFQGDILRSDLRKIEKALIRSENTIWPNGLNVA
ncbi:GIY-YIG nuclease family protein [Shimia sp. SDUM112013]|uniref:GIY-YIG nuclease family protein n=1 Tax=Shimia sp. SDUM112013 TaxID=3136160 RepID=UPI0032EEAD83